MSGAVMYHPVIAVSLSSPEFLYAASLYTVPLLLGYSIYIPPNVNENALAYLVPMILCKNYNLRAGDGSTPHA
jgi:hypothetical protein